MVAGFKTKKWSLETGELATRGVSRNIINSLISEISQLEFEQFFSAFHTKSVLVGRAKTEILKPLFRSFSVHTPGCAGSLARLSDY